MEPYFDEAIERLDHRYEKWILRVLSDKVDIPIVLRDKRITCDAGKCCRRDILFLSFSSSRNADVTLITTARDLPTI